MKILIINTGGNVHSLKNILNFCGYESKVYEKKADLDNYDVFFLPGIGAFDNCIRSLKDLDIFEILRDKNFLKKKRIFGICAGMQILFEESEEGNLKGLSLLKGKVKKFDNLHMGWNNVYSDKIELDNRSDLFYFAHNYFVDCDKSLILAHCKHNFEFPAIVHKDNIYGIQFHPEKSHTNGIDLLKKILISLN